MPWVDRGSQTSLCYLTSKAKKEKDLTSGRDPSLGAVTSSTYRTIRAANGWPHPNPRAHRLPCAREGEQQHCCKNKPLGKLSLLSSERLGKKIFFMSKYEYGTNLCVHLIEGGMPWKGKVKGFPLHSIC